MGNISSSEEDDYEQADSAETVPEGYITLYHYTDLKGAKGIVSSNRILKSTSETSTDALCGEGTYLTDKSPSRHTKIQIAKDIWVNKDKLHDQMVREGRTDFVFEIIIKRVLVKEERPEHHIWRYPMKDLQLDDKSVVYNWYVEETDEVEREYYEHDLTEVGVSSAVVPT